VAQRLARRLCQHCAEEHIVTADELPTALGIAPGTPIPPLMRPVGCNRCSNTGYRGRVALHEIMTVSESIERLAVARASAAEIQRAAQEEGLETLLQDGWAKVLEGTTSLEELFRVVK